MGKAKISHKKDDEKRKKNNVIVSLVIVFIMVLSMVGFVVMSGGNPQGQQNGEISDFPLTENAFRDTAGNSYWGAVKNSEQFVFADVEGYEQRTDLIEIAEKLKNQRVVELYIDDNITDSNAKFMIEQKISDAFEISFAQTEDMSCDKENKLIITSSNNISGNCMIIQTSDQFAEEDTQTLAFHMLR
jgi:hypothetical protein